MLRFIRAQPNVVSKILSHLGTSAIIDLLLTLIRLEELPEGQGVVEVCSDFSILCNFFLDDPHCTLAHNYNIGLWYSKEQMEFNECDN